MNTQCFGHRFRINGADYFRCLYDGAVALGEVKDGQVCPMCTRMVMGSPGFVKSVVLKAKVELEGIGVVGITLPTELS